MARQPNEMEFSDLEIEKAYRRKKLGTALVKLVISHLRDKGIRRIYGSVAKKDLEDFPQLVRWWESFDFRRGNKYDYAVSGAIAYMYLDLD